MILHVIKTTFQRKKTIEKYLQELKHFVLNKFKINIRTKTKFADNYDSFEKEFLKGILMQI